jgi:uracil-DNA glycosylase
MTTSEKDISGGKLTAPCLRATETLDHALAAARACTICAAVLPLGARPVLRGSVTSRLLIASQAPGTKVHETGLPFDDASGDRLRGWLEMDRDTFYDERQIAFLPMGLCYPGRLPNGGDAPPRPECAPLWRPRILPLLTGLRLTLLVGSYAIDGALGRGAMAERVQNFERYLPRYLPLPHPSWRTSGWEKRNPWFQERLIPALRREVARALEHDRPNRNRPRA